MFTQDTLDVGVEEKKVQMTPRFHIMVEPDRIRFFQNGN